MLVRLGTFILAFIFGLRYRSLHKVYCDGLHFNLIGDEIHQSKRTMKIASTQRYRRQYELDLFQ